MHATKPQTFNYFSLPWREAGAEGEEIKLSIPQSPATAFCTRIASIGAESLKWLSGT